MNKQLEIYSEPQVQVGQSPETPLLTFGMKRMEPLQNALSMINSSLDDLAGVSDEARVKKVRRIQNQIADFQPCVTFIGQVKAGKTTLVNAMVGVPGLLPSDVNPWTSVVTTLNINAGNAPVDTRAEFKFFEMDEWDKLLTNGGRIGELAGRIGAGEEFEQVKKQVAEMQEKTRARLGRKFELLLGKEHKYGSFDNELIKRYVCLSEDADGEELDEETANQGRFADITKSADLYLDRPEISASFSLRDTPGVNDTFMMREQITISAVREAQICVVVLSAHQALNTMDMALIRLIANVKSREVIIFVNRIDELADPGHQVPEIRKSIRETLKSHDGPKDCEIIFGSAYWADLALSENLGEMTDDSADALVNWAQTTAVEPMEDPKTFTWILSGLPKLYDAIGQRIVEGPGQTALTKAHSAAMNLVNGARATNSVASLQTADGGPMRVDARSVASEFDMIYQSHVAALDKACDDQMQALADRMGKAQDRFVKRATDALIHHLQNLGEQEVWQYNPNGLRLLLRSAYQAFARNSHKITDTIFAAAANDVQQLYVRQFSLSIDGFRIDPPLPTRVPPPVALGQTIVLDMQGGWWKKWWQRRKGYEAFASNFADLIASETTPMITELRDMQADKVLSTNKVTLRAFLDDQRETLMAIAQKSDVRVEDLETSLGITKQQTRKDVTDKTLAVLESITLA